MATAAGLIVTAIIWALTQWANRRHEVFKERLKCRMKMFDVIFPTLFQLSEIMTSNDVASINAASSDMLVKIKLMKIDINCYGNKNEIELYNRLIKSLMKDDQGNIEAARIAFLRAVTNNLRAELSMKPLFLEQKNNSTLGSDKLAC